MNLRNLLGLALPPVCAGCGSPLVSSEGMLCLGCLASLDRLAAGSVDARSLRERIAHRTPLISTVYSWLQYTHENLTGTLIRHGKYDDRPDIFEYLGAKMAAEIKAIRVFDSVDLLIPVPMHRWKRLSRGYNQARILADKISRATGIQVADCLRMTRRQTSQTHRSATERHAAARGLFLLTDKTLVTGRHVALIDDIITSGATISAAAAPILDAAPASLTIISLAATVKQ